MKKSIEEFLAHLTEIEYYDTDYGMSMFPSNFTYELSVTRCTSSAMLIAQKFGGQVFGYQVDDLPENKEIIGYCCGGHDFAVVDHYLVDWWAKNVECCGPAILDFEDPADLLLIEKTYFPRSEWDEPLELWPLKPDDPDKKFLLSTGA